MLYYRTYMMYNHVCLKPYNFGQKIASVFLLRIDLLAFAVTHCDANMIEMILRAKCLLQTQV